MDIHEKIKTSHQNIINNRIYFLIFFIMVVLLVIFSGSIGPSHFKFSLFTLFISVILGFFCLLYYFNHKNELHKVAFVTVICFGVICAFINPILAAPDEVEHFARSLLTSQGNLFPQYFQLPSNYTGLNLSGFAVDTTEGFFALYSNQRIIFFDSNLLNIPINNVHAFFITAFLHNPFYGYLAQGFGIFIANILNLSTIWMLWLGRIFNVILYAFLISIAVKKSPIFKVPLLFMALLPLSIYQAASMSIDVTINGLGFIVVAYFLYLFKSKEMSISSREIIIFSVLILLLSLTKVTYLAFILLFLCIPKDRFKVPYYYIAIPIVVVSILTILWSYQTTPIYDFSRQQYYLLNNVNSTEQISYLLTHKKDFILAVLNIIPTIGRNFLYTFYFYTINDEFTSVFLSVFGCISLFAVIFLYPIDEKFSLKYRLAALFVLAINYFGTYIIQLLKWTPVSQIFIIQGVQARYFIPLLGLLPFICTFDYKKFDIEKFNNIIVVFSVSLLIGLISLLLFKYY